MRMTNYYRYNHVFRIRTETLRSFLRMDVFDLYNYAYTQTEHVRVCFACIHTENMYVYMSFLRTENVCVAVCVCLNDISIMISFIDTKPNRRIGYSCLNYVLRTHTEKSVLLCSLCFLFVFPFCVSQINDSGSNTVGRTWPMVVCP